MRHADEKQANTQERNITFSDMHLHSNIQYVKLYVQGWIFSVKHVLKMNSQYMFFTSWCLCAGTVTVSHYHCLCFVLLLQSALTCTCPSSQQSEQSPKDMSHPCAPIKDSTRDNTAAFHTQRSKNEVRPPDSSPPQTSTPNTTSSSSDRWFP